MLQINNLTLDNAVIFGGVSTNNASLDRHGNAAIQKAKAIRLVYVLSNRSDSDDWIQSFCNFASKLQYSDAQIFYTSSASLPKEMERNGEVINFDY